MGNKNYTTRISVDRSPKQVFNAINNVRGWWSENIDGNTDKLDAEFLYHYKDVHICKLKIVELVPDKKVVWLVLKNEFNFTKDQNEWKGNKIVFEITDKGGHTELQFTQLGLTPEYECYNVCNDAWTSYIQGSLKDLIVTGKGKPNTKENDSLNKELIEKWGLPDKQATNNQDIQNYTFVFESAKTPESIFETLIDVRKWWTGLFGEDIKGNSKKINDEFTFNAGDGMHYSKQRLIELQPDKKIVWQVIDSKLSFVEKTDEWTNSKISFEITKQVDKSRVTFTHQGLVPKTECYRNCTDAWTQYLEKLARNLK